MTGYFREVLMVFLIVFIHELGHAGAAHYFKWRIHKVELLPFGGVAEVEDSGNKHSGGASRYYCWSVSAFLDDRPFLFMCRSAVLVSV